MPQRNAYALFAKRLVDIALGLALLPVASVLILLAAVLILLDTGRPVFFKQMRAGRHGEPIQVTKLRTLITHARSTIEVGQVTLDHELVTRAGRFLRRYGIDELPQLWSVIRGDLSLVGPRPTLLEQVAEYDDYQRRRLELRPGLTGWAQVNGRFDIPWETRIALDVWYVDHVSFILDLKILGRTVDTLLRGEQADPDAIEQALSHADRAGRSS